MIYIIIGVVILLAIVALYNRLATLKIRTKEAWADIDVQLKRRYDLIPNLIETVKGYAKHEKETLDAVVAARSNATSMNVDLEKVTPEQISAFTGAESGLTGSLGKLMAIAENYPDLKANQNFSELQRELADTEDKIQASRRFFNTTIREFKTSIATFPSNIIAKIFGFSSLNFFELPEDSKERDVVKVSF